MPIPSPGNYDTASQITALAIKAKTDLIGANVALETGGKIDAIKAKTDLIGANIIPLHQLRGSVVQGTWVSSPDASITVYMNDPYIVGVAARYMSNTTQAINDEYVYPKVYMAAGNYSAELYYMKHANAGILSIYHGASLLGTVDMYSAGTTYNNKIVVDFNIPVDVVDSIRFVIAAKNGAAAAYGVWLQSVLIWRRT